MSGGGTMGGGGTDILIFVEDPGAANGIIDLPWALAASGYKARIIAAGHAVPHLASLGGEFSEPDADAGAAALMDAASPRMIIAGTSENRDTIGLQLIAEARKRGVQNVGFVDGPANVESRFRGSGDAPLAFAPEWILVPDGITRRRYEALGHPAGRIVDCGHPYFDRARATGRELAGRGRDAVRAGVLPEVPADRRVVVFLAEISVGLTQGRLARGPDYTLAGRGGSDLRTHVVIEEVLDALAPVDPRPYFVLRLHPKNKAGEFAAYETEIDILDQSGTAAELVFAADLVVGMTTMLLFEAALMGRPTLSVVPRPEETAWLTSIDLGLTPAVNTSEALREILPAAVADPERLMGKSPDEVINFGALDRMTDFLAGLLAEGNEDGA